MDIKFYLHSEFNKIGCCIAGINNKYWRFSGHPYLSGEIESTRIDAAALGLVPLKLTNFGIWNPNEQYWGEEDEAIEEWIKPIIARGSRPEFVIEQVIPREDPDDPFEDPIIRSADLNDAGDNAEAQKILMDLCQSDLRCLDAHSQLGNFKFDLLPKDAIHHYEIGLRIGELSLGPDFDGVLQWCHTDNRPFLRCLHGYGLCIWYLGDFEKAEDIFTRLLWLNPQDNQGVRFLIEDIRAGRTWMETESYLDK